MLYSVFGIMLLSSMLYGFMVEDVYGLQLVAGKIEVNLSPGESKIFQLGLMSDNPDADSVIELRAEGPGAEFLSFPKSITLGPKQLLYTDVTVSIPEDHQNDVLLKPNLFALERGQEGGSTVINVQMRKTVSLIIGDPIIEEPEKTSALPKCGPGTVLKDGKCVAEQKPMVDKETTPSSSLQIKSEPKSEQKTQSEGGGCLIATAAFGTELAPQVQFLREIRDNTLHSTGSGSAFMSAFNDFYYSFSPTIADWERESPIFKESVKLFITPMITSLSIMTLAEPGSEGQVLGLGISIIILNIGLYIAGPTVAIAKLARKI